MVTAEIALGLSALAVVLAGGLWVVGAVSDQVRCQDAARDVARAVARGETEQAARAAGRRNAPDGARIRIGEDGGWVHVIVTVDAAPPWPALGGLPSVDVSATAAAAYEPGEPDASGSSGGTSGSTSGGSSGGTSGGSSGNAGGSGGGSSGSSGNAGGSGTSGG